MLAACLDAKVPYLDYPDDVKSTQESLDLFERAKQQGVPCHINCGSSLVVTNLMAVDAAKELDSVERPSTLRATLPTEVGRMEKEVLDHLMHITAGPRLTWADGKPAVHEKLG